MLVIPPVLNVMVLRRRNAMHAFKTLLILIGRAKIPVMRAAFIVLENSKYLTYVSNVTLTVQLVTVCLIIALLVLHRGHTHHS